MNGAQRLPVFPLDTVLYPGGPLPLRIFEPRYVDMISHCMRTASAFVVSAIVDGSETGEASFHDVGTLATVIDFQQLPDGLLGILVKGGERAQLTERARKRDGLESAMIARLSPETPVGVPKEYDDLVSLLHRLLDPIPETYYPAQERAFDDASWVGYRLAELLPLGLAQKQYFLEMEDALRRLEVIRPLLESMQTTQRT